MTVTEYLDASRYRRFAYRLARSPFVLFIISPLVLFVFLQRIPLPKMGVRERHSVWSMNVALLLFGATVSTLIGFWPYLVFQLAILTLAGSAGMWLFYVQHQFEGVAWARTGNWSHRDAALLGSSYYDLPGLLRWISGNIGIHHIHHLNSRIPYYRLPRVLRDHPELKMAGRLTLWDSFKGVRLSLWCEKRKKLVSFRAVRSR
jgi:omega-6 fatty acid desaturase (delta-12 desaturase)